MKIYSYVGAGNDFVLLPDFDETIPDGEIPALAKKLCHRENGRNVDGFMLLRRSSEAHCRMLFYNSDGSAAEMCGNGARCLCRFLHDYGFAGETQRIATPAGIVTGQWLGGNQYRIRLNSPSVSRLAEDLSYVELGEPGIPHVVLPRPEALDRESLRDFARKLRYDPSFPRGANVNLYRLTGENRLELLTYERGVEDFTLACGTGTGATVYALTRLGKLCGKHTEVCNEGGTLHVDVIEEQGAYALYLSGPADEQS